MSDNELEFWAHSVERVCRAAKCDPRSREVGVFVIFVREGATMPEYAPAPEAPKGAYLVERWVLVGTKRKVWVLRI
jgi:hypothetical protein